jgi:hypothetical protein
VEEDVVAVPYPKFHPVPARPVFGPPGTVAWPAPTDQPLPPARPGLEHDLNPPSRDPSAPPLNFKSPAAGPSRQPHLLGNALQRPSWVFPTPAVKSLSGTPATRRLAIPEPESRQAIQERTQPIRR